ncbi:MAG: UPF0182 family protein [Myxococcales bacterium]|nr:UPF0182 family protein [Myxococcales bacterium]
MARPLERRTIQILVAVATLVVAVVAVPGLAHLWVELAWFEELGHPDVLTTPLYAQLGLGLVTGLLAFAILGGNARLAVRLAKDAARPAPIHLGDGQTLELDVRGAVARLALPLSFAVSVVFALVGAGRWQSWLLLTHGRAFGEIDPVFSRDVGFYVFTLPFLDHLFWTLASVLVLALLGAGLVHVVSGSLRLGGQSLRGARVHVSVLGAAVFLVLAYGAWLASAHLVVSQDGLVAGAGYTDVHARLPAIRAHLAVAVVGAVMIGISATRKRLVLVWAAIALYGAVFLVGRVVYPAVIQSYVVEPNELDRERPWLEAEIAATRSAFALDAMTERELSGERVLTWPDVEANRATVDNVRLWDHRPLLDTFGQIQEIRTYYDFVSVDNDRYVIDGRLRQTMLSPRELAPESLPNRTWINEHLTFTHGYGLTLGPVNEADEEGLPVLLVQDIPPASTVQGLEVTRPQIYFGELGADYVFVESANREFDHPAAQGNVYASYEGTAGIEVGGAAFRAALALETGDAQVLLSDDVRSDSRVLLHREVADRVHRLAPFLRMDGDPYLVVRDDGTLAWVLDAYTVTDRFPYARATSDGVSYIRNSVKAVVDAYDGTVHLYAADPDDPILATWSAIFEGLFEPLDAMPADLRRHLRYPIDIFAVQARMLTVFHMNEPALLYNREDQWEVPALTRSGTRTTMDPYYTVMRLPGEADAEFILMLPFTPARKDNLAAWMVARSDGDHLGELVVYRFPNDRLVYGPQQVLNRINQEAHISQQLSLWDQRGSQADFGRLLVIPIEESLIYVLPLYLRSSGGRIPQLKRVIVVYDNRIAMAETLEAAVEEVFQRPALARAEPDAEDDGAGPATDAATDATTDVAANALAENGDEVPADPAVAALRHYERAVAAQRRGDWATYGVELEALEVALRRLQPEDLEAPDAPAEPAN